MDALVFLACSSVFLLGVAFTLSAKIIQEYERGVVFRFGRVQPKPLTPGLRFIIPFMDRLHKVDLRIITLDVPTQEAISKDNVTVRVNAVVYFKVIDPTAAIIEVENYRRATMQIAQTTMRNVIGQSSLDQLLSDREAINDTLRTIIDEATEPWGIMVTVVEVKDVELDKQMIRAMAREAEAERERRAKVIHAEGELQASKKLSEAAGVIAREPGAMTLRYLQTLVEIGVENNTTTIFPLPIDLLSSVLPKIRPEDAPLVNDNGREQD